MAEYKCYTYGDMIVEGLDLLDLSKAFSALPGFGGVLYGLFENKLTIANINIARMNLNNTYGGSSQIFR